MLQDMVSNILKFMYDVGRVLDLTSPIRILVGIIDIVIVALIVYSIFKAMKETRARQIFKGLLILCGLLVVAKICNLVILKFLLTNFMTYGVLILIVVFQPELRNVFEKIGRSKIVDVFDNNDDMHEKNSITEIVKATEIMSMKNIGALIVLQRNSKITDVLKEGISLSANVSSELIQNIFYPKAPLHDGAIVVDGSVILSAKCILPLAYEMSVPKNLGTRHRAAVGITEISDALVVVVSEETGTISLAEDGKLTQKLTPEKLKDILLQKLQKGRNTAVIKNKIRNKT